MYNKNQFKKLNDKKLLHKIGKRWITVSIALLGLLGGGAAVTHVGANADATNDDQNQANHQTNISQLQNNKTTLQTNDQSNHSSQYVQNSQNQIHNINNGTNHQLSSTIIQRANRLHSRIINHANFTNINNDRTKAVNSNNLKLSSGVNRPVRNDPKRFNQNSDQFNNSNMIQISNKRAQTNPIYVQDKSANNKQAPVNQTISDGTIDVNYVDKYTNKIVKSFSKRGPVTGGFTYTRYIDPKSKDIPTGYKLPESPIIKGDDIHEFKVNPQTLVIGIIPIKSNNQVATVSIQYKDFNGNSLKTVNNVKGLAGAKINYKPYEAQSDLPNGYEFAFLDGNPTFNNGDIEDIMVKPSSDDSDNGSNSDNDLQHITNSIIYEDDQTGHPVGSAPISGPIDAIVNYAEYDNNDSNYMPKGYHFDKTANVSISKSNVNFGAPGSGTYLEPKGVYRILVSHNKSQLQNISTQLIYESASDDNSTISYAPLSGRVGSKVDYSKYENGSQYMPKGYHYDQIAPSSSNTLKYGGKYIILVNKKSNDNNSATNNSAESSAAKSADASIANYYKKSIADSVSEANQSKANSAAESADQSIENSISVSYSNSISNSINSMNTSIANSYAQSADTSIANSYRNSIAIINQSLASSAANSANNRIAASESASVSNSVSALDSRIANSAASSADRKIASSVAQSVSNSVSLQNSKIASSAASSANSRSASISNDANVLASASSEVISLMTSLGNGIEAKYGPDAARIANSYVNKMLSYHNDAITNDRQAMNSLANLHPTNSSISSLDTHDINEVSNNRKFMILKDISMISGFKEVNAQRHVGSFNIGSAITSASNDITVASMNDQSTESILNHDVSELVAMNTSASASNANNTSNSSSNSINASNSASLSASKSASSSASLSNSIKFNAHVSASDLVKNDINEIDSYDQIAQNNDSTAVSELNGINVSSNASLNALKSNDVNEAYDDDSIVNEDVGLAENLNSKLRDGSYEPNVAINSANSQVMAASEVANDAGLIIADDITALESASNQARSNSSNSNHPTSNNNSNNPNGSVTTSSAKNAINMDQTYLNIYSGQIERAASNPDVQSNVLASSAISNDTKIASNASQMIANDQLNPNAVNTYNANKEVSSAELADKNARQVIASVMSSIASSSANINHSNTNTINSNEKDISMDKMFVDDDANQIRQYDKNSNVSSNPLALFKINKDSSVVNSAYQAVANDQLNPNIINVYNANEELSSTESADRDARQVVSSIMNSAASALATKHSNSDTNITSNNSNANINSSNGINPQNSANSSNNVSSNTNSATNTNHGNVTPSPSNNQSTPSNTPSDTTNSDTSDTTEDNNDNSDEDYGNNANDDTENHDTDASDDDDTGTKSNMTDANADNAVSSTKQTNDTNNSSSNLPQTGESSHKKAIAAALLALSSIGLLIGDKKHRYNW